MSTRSPTSSQAGTDRQEKFRAFMRRFNPTAPARVSIEQGLIVEQPSETFAKFAVRADLEPGSQQLVAGGIGSGKTTQLLLTERWLLKQGKTVPMYIDVSAETDLASLNSGAVLASVGLHLLKRIDLAAAPQLVTAHEQITTFALGRFEEVPYDDYGYEDYEANYGDYPPDAVQDEPPSFVRVKVPGKLRPLRPRFPALHRDIEAITESMAQVADAARAPGGVLVAILDGLDRLMAPSRFWEVVYQDFRVLRDIQISVVAAAPLTILYGQGRPVSDYFDSVHHLPAYDPTVSPFLMQVLEKRDAAVLMGLEESESLCKASGGALRDLISLARNAAEQAYLSGSETIQSPHASKAIRQLGESYLLGLGESHLAILRKLREGGSFSTDDSSSMELLVTRRILEYHDPRPRYEVHPTLAPLLNGEEKKPGPRAK